jgi:hypothetical protein
VDKGTLNTSRPAPLSAAMTVSPCLLHLLYLGSELLAGHKIVDENGKGSPPVHASIRGQSGQGDDYMKVFFSDEAHPFTKAMLEELLYI